MYGNVLGTDTTEQTVADSVATKAAQCSFATVTTMRARVKAAIGTNVAVDFQKGYGKFLVLCRCGLSGAGEVHLRMGTGVVNNTFNYTDPFAKRGRVSVTNTGWKFYELGVVQFPLGGYTASIERNDQQGIQIEAERITGAISLNLDIIVFIPIAEGWGHVSDMTDSGDDTYGVVVGTTYQSGAYAYQAENPVGSGVDTPASPIVQISGGIPIGTSSMVYLILCGQRAASSVKADTITLDELFIKERYRELRGAG